MNIEHDRLYELLCEFDDICSKEKIEYFLTGEALLCAVTKGVLPDTMGYVNVIMDCANVKKFIKAAAGRKDRTLDYWGNDPDYPDFSVRYVDEKSLCIDVTDYENYKAHGMFVAISILRGKFPTDDKSQKIEAIEKGRAQYLTGGSETTGRELKQYKRATMILGKAKVMDRLFNYICRKCKGPKSKGKGYYGTYDITFAEGKGLTLSASYFARGGAKASLDGREFPGPRFVVSFLNKAYKGRLTPMDDGYVMEGKAAGFDRLIVRAGVSYADYFQSLAGDEAGLKGLRQLAQDAEKIKDQRKGYRKKAAHDWKAVRAADYRYKMWEFYTEDRKTEIRKLHEAGDYKGLRRAFGPYTDALEEAAESNIVFSFDEEMLDIYYDMMAHFGLNKRMDAMIQGMPKSHEKKVEQEREGGCHE